MNTGLLTSICAVASLVSITAAPNTFYYIGFFFCIGRLYCNSLLAALNVRKNIRTYAEAINASSLGNVAFLLKDGPGTKSTHARDISIRVDTAKEFAIDGGSDQSSGGPGFPFKEKSDI